jgi:hypothetical protein
MQPDRHDELSSGVPADDHEQRSASAERKAGGPGIPPGATVVPAEGGRARKGRTQLTHAVPETLPVSDTLKRRARYARKRIATELARTVGGGACGMLASLMVKLGVEDAAMREAALAEGKVDLARRLGESARMHLLYARETCAKDATARPKDGGNALPIWAMEGEPEAAMEGGDILPKPPSEETDEASE